MEAEKKCVEVVAIDGDQIRRLLWIKQTKDGSIYWRLVSQEIDLHSTYHASGAFHFSKHSKRLKRQKLSELKEEVTSPRLLLVFLKSFIYM